jgi:hypothetical protein
MTAQYARANTLQLTALLERAYLKVLFHLGLTCHAWHPQAGCNIEQLRQSTKATIKVERDTPGCPDRLICISSMASAAEPLCHAQEALFSIHERLSVMDTSEPFEMVRNLQTIVQY